MKLTGYDYVIIVVFWAYLITSPFLGIYLVRQLGWIGVIPGMALLITWAVVFDFLTQFFSGKGF